MVYMPCVATLLSDTDKLDAAAVSSRHAENVPMFLPSCLPSTLHPQLGTTGISPGLLDKEIKLCVAQADDALAELCCLRHLVTGLVLFKKLNISGTSQKKIRAFGPYSSGLGIKLSALLSAIELPTQPLLQWVLMVSATCLM